MEVRDALVAPVWLAVNLLLLAAAWRLAGWLLPGERSLYRTFHTGVLAFGVVVGVAIGLGAFSVLSPVTLLTSVALLSAAGLGLLGNRRFGTVGAPARLGRPSVADVGGVGRPAPSASSNNAVGSPAASNNEVERQSPSVREGDGCGHNGAAAGSRRVRLERCVLRFWAVLFALLLGHVIEGGVFQFPTDWDSLMYHIPLIDHWLAAGSLYAPASPRWYEPANNELIGLWMVAPFSGDFLISLNNFPAIAILVGSLIMLLDELKVSLLIRHAGALLVVSHYVVMRQTLDAGNDLPVAAFFVATVAYGLRYVRRMGVGDLVLAATSLGLLCGVKYYALGYAAAAGGVVFGLAWLLRGRGAALRLAGAGALFVVVFAGYYYARNVAVTGLPLYPKGFTERGDLLTADRGETIWRSSLLGTNNPEAYPLVAAGLWKMTGPAHCAAVLCVFPGMACWLLASGYLRVRRPRGSLMGVFRISLVVLIGACAVIWGITPYGVETLPGTLNMARWGYSPVRFGLCFFSLALVALVVASDDLAGLFARIGRRRGLASPCSEAAADEGRPKGSLKPERQVWVRHPLLALRARIRKVTGNARRWPSVAVAGCFVGLAVWQLTSRLIRDLPGDLLFASIIGLDIVLAAVVIRRMRSRWHFPPNWAIVGGGLIGFGLATCWLSQSWHAGFAAHYDRMFDTSLFSELAGASPSETCICACNYRYYPFFGSRRQLRVYRPQRVRSFEDLLGYLSESGATLLNLVEWDNDAHYVNVKGWVSDHPEVFAMLRSERHFSTYRVDQSALQAALKNIRREPKDVALQPKIELHADGLPGAQARRS